MIDPSYPHLSIRQQCQLLSLNRSSLYYAPKIEQLRPEQLDLLKLVDETYTRYPFFGTRQTVNYLKNKGYETLTRYQVRWAYERLGLRSLAPGPHTSKPHPEHKIYPYLLRNLKIKAPNQVWSTDITYIRLRKGFVYLMAVIDWFSRFVLDWELSISLEADFCIETLQRLLENDRCEIFNTDQGAQFTSKGFTSLLEENGIKISMDGKGRALDNIFVERLWRSVKYECVYLMDWETVGDAKSDLADYFQFYNHERPHQALSGNTPSSIHFGAIN
jgi:putative transposase